MQVNSDICYHHPHCYFLCDDGYLFCLLDAMIPTSSFLALVSCLATKLALFLSNLFAVL